MAIIRSLLLSSIRGSIAGTTFSQNRYGAYARNRTVPVNPNTTAQQTIRAAMGNASIGWRNLTDTNRTLWVNYASATPVTNRLGESVFLSGQAMYNKYATFNLYAGHALPTIPPPTPGLAGQLFPAGFVAEDVSSTNPNGLTMQYTNGSTGAAATYVIYISAPQSAGKTFFKGPWIKVAVKTGATRGALSTVPYSMAEDQLVFTRIAYADAEGKIATDTIQGPIAVVNLP